MCKKHDDDHEILNERGASAIEYTDPIARKIIKNVLGWL